MAVEAWMRSLSDIQLRQKIADLEKIADREKNKPTMRFAGLGIVSCFVGLGFLAAALSSVFEGAPAWFFLLNIAAGALFLSPMYFEQRVLKVRQSRSDQLAALYEESRWRDAARLKVR